MVRNLSIIIPHYQKQQSLTKVIDELKIQISPEDRITIIDDWSPDGVPDFNCLCTKVIRPSKREPHIYRLNTLRNYGLEHAAHDFCIILDPDCVPNPHFLDNARKMCDASVLFGGAIDYQMQDGSLKEDARHDWNNGSKWVDDNVMRASGVNIWGGCMFMSRERTRLVGWFSEDFNGAWGAEEHEFANRCHHSGIRLRYSTELTVTHLWHPPNREGYERNKRLWQDKIKINAEALNDITPYNPATAVLMVSMMRPYYIDQTMRAIFRTPIPLKVRLVNNGDQTEEQRRKLEPWSKRWSVDYIDYKSQELLSSIRSDAMKNYNEKGYKYLIMLDDDITPMTGSLVSLISEMETHKQYHALSGYIFDGGENRFIGGKIKNGIHYYYQIKPETMPTNYISSGFTIIRLDKVIPYSEGWEMGWNDWDWSNEIRKQGLQMGVTGKAGAYHRQLFTVNGREQKEDSDAYKHIRYDRERHNRMAEKFREKWGYTPKPARCITEMKT